MPEAIPPPPEVTLVSATARRFTGQPRIVVLDPDSGFTRMLAGRMNALGWACTVLATSPGLAELLRMRLSALILDPAELSEDRWGFLEQLGCQAPELAVIICTSPTSVTDRIRGLHLAADDWLTKPCHAGEVLARVQAILRRSQRA